MPETCRNWVSATCRQSKSSTDARAIAGPARSYVTLIGRGADASSTKYSPSLAFGTQRTRDVSTPPAISAVATRWPSGLSGRAETHADLRPTRAAAYATLASDPAT